MKIKILLPFIMAAIISGCSSGAPEKTLPPVKITKPSLEEADLFKKITLSKLKDPESARFSNEIFVVDADYACVQVNSKNSFGGYVGYKWAFLFKSKGQWMVSSSTLQPDLNECVDLARDIARRLARGECKGC